MSLPGLFPSSHRCPEVLSTVASLQHKRVPSPLSLTADIPPDRRTSPPGAPARPPVPAPLHIIAPSNGPSDTVRVMLNDAERPPSAGTAFRMDERAAHERECGVVRLEHAGSGEDQRPAFEVLVVVSPPSCSFEPYSVSQIRLRQPASPLPLAFVSVADLNAPRAGLRRRTIRDQPIKLLAQAL